MSFVLVWLAMSVIVGIFFCRFLAISGAPDGLKPPIGGQPE